MSEIVLLGNGFDLHHGLPTRYSNMLHFMDYMSRSDTHLFGESSVADVLQDYLDYCNYGLHGIKIDNDLKAYYEKYRELLFSIPFDQHRFHELRNKLNSSFWFMYFLDCVNTEMRWVDFESEIQKILMVFEKIFKAGMVLDSREDSKVRHLFQNTKYLNEYYRENSNSCIRARHPENFLADTTYSNPLMLIDKKFLTKDNEYSWNILDVHAVVRALYEDLDIIKEAIAFYISSFIDSITPHLAPSSSLGHLASARCVVSLNYSHTYQNIYLRDSDDNNSTMIYQYHGNSVDKNIVLGVNSVRAIDGLDREDVFLSFSKFFQRYMHDGLCEYDRDITNLLQGLDKPIHLCVIGHSLDSTDSDIIKRLFAMSQKITIFYYNEEDKINHKRNLVRIFEKENLIEMNIKGMIEHRQLGNYMD